jgi:hypothetical protein
MNSDRRSCTHCGNQLEAGAGFCGFCGQPVSGQNLAPPPIINTPVRAAPAAPLQATPGPTGMAATTSPALSGEKLVGVIPGISRKRGFFKFESFNAVVTDRRIIFALLTNEIMKEEAKKNAGGGIGAIFKAAMAGGNTHQRYQQMSPEDALKENLENFAIEIARIRKVKVQRGSEGFELGPNQKDEEGKLYIETVGEKLSFVLKNYYCDTALQLLRQAGLA